VVAGAGARGPSWSTLATAVRGALTLPTLPAKCCCRLLARGAWGRVVWGGVSGIGAEQGRGSGQAGAGGGAVWGCAGVRGRGGVVGVRVWGAVGGCVGRVGSAGHPGWQLGLPAKEESGKKKKKKPHVLAGGMGRAGGGRRVGHVGTGRVGHRTLASWWGRGAALDGAVGRVCGGPQTTEAQPMARGHVSTGSFSRLRVAWGAGRGAAGNASLACRHGHALLTRGGGGCVGGAGGGFGVGAVVVGNAGGGQRRVNGSRYAGAVRGVGGVLCGGARFVCLGRGNVGGQCGSWGGAGRQGFGGCMGTPRAGGTGGGLGQHENKN